MRELFKCTVRMAVSLELVDPAVHAVDGTKMTANAAARRTYTAEQLRQLLERVEKAIRDLEPRTRRAKTAFRPASQKSCPTRRLYGNG